MTLSSRTPIVESNRSRLGVAGFVLASALAVALLAAGAAPAKPASDGNDAAGPLDITSAGISQQGRSARIEVRTAGDWTTSDFDGSPNTLAISASYLCVEFRQGGEGRRICIRRKTGGAQGDEMVVSKIDDAGNASASHSIDADLSRPTPRSFVATAPLGAFGLEVGGFNWRAASSWLGTPGCDPTACTDRVPDTSWLKGRIAEPYVTACTPRRKGLVLRGSTAGKRVALTFDDGPSAYTASVMSILRKKKVKGTFFVIGEQVSGGRKLLHRMVREGFEIGNHSMHHEIYPGFSSLRATSAAIKRASGFKPCSFRPPYGAVNSGVISAARRNGMTTINWDRDTMDWSLPGTGHIMSVGKSARSGSIVLMHDGGGTRSQTVAALPSIISSLKSRGYKLVTVSQLLGNRLVWGPRQG